MKAVSEVLCSALERLEERGWDHIYILVDVHGVLMEPSYGSISTKIYPQCIKPMLIMSDDPRIKLIMWTCSSPEHITQYLAMFKELGINFDYANENPDVQYKQAIGDYTVKLYANLILDDKAGFDPYKDWDNLSRYCHDFMIASKTKLPPDELNRLGYCIVSRTHHTVARIDRADWEKIVIAHKPHMKGYRVDMLEDYYRRTFSKDKLTVPTHYINNKLIRNSAGATTGHTEF